MSVDIIMPPLSQTMDSMVLLAWTKKVGETVKKGEALFTVETDKASLEVESPASGTLFEIYVQPNSEAKVRAVIGKILEPGESAPAKTGNLIDQNKNTTTEAPVEKKAIKEGQQRPSSGKILASPRARRLADQNHIDLTLVQASGPRHMIVERDVQIALKNTPQSQTVAQIDTTQPVQLSNVRKTISRRMMDSHLNTAPVTYMSEVDATRLVALRDTAIQVLGLGHIRPTYTDFLIKLVCLTLQKHPDLNATFDGETLVHSSEVNLALAVDTDRGLIVPVLRNANQYGITALAEKRQALVERATKGQSSPDELSGGTFTISNLGTLGIDFFTPIINPPQVAILAVGRIREVPAVENGQICIRKKMGLAVTCDHRIIDGAPAARFLKDVSALIENPDLLWINNLLSGK